MRRRPRLVHRGRALGEQAVRLQEGEQARGPRVGREQQLRGTRRRRLRRAGSAGAAPSDAPAAPRPPCAAPARRGRGGRGSRGGGGGGGARHAVLVEARSPVEGGAI